MWMQVCRPLLSLMSGCPVTIAAAIEADENAVAIGGRNGDLLVIDYSQGKPTLLKQKVTTQASPDIVESLHNGRPTTTSAKATRSNFNLRL